MRILFANIGWMIYYKGQNPNDTISGGGSYDNSDKHEAYNFQDNDGWCYGYVETPKQGRMKLYRIDSSVSKNKLIIEDVLVIWTATKPKIGGTYIVGWYQHATVYADYQDSKKLKNRGGYSFNIKAKSSDCTLLSVDDRILSVPRAKVNPGGMGQSNIWYADNPLPYVKQFRKDVVEYVISGSVKRSVNKTNFKVNVEARKEVETEAVNFVIKNYKKLGYAVISVEKDNLGWDLEARKERELLHIEVKGLAGEEVSVRLTPNEYSKMKALDYSYRLCVVTCALTNPLLYTFMFVNNNWSCEINGEVHHLDFDESVAAIAYLK